MVDIDFCISSYLAFRYIENEEKDFSDLFHHKNLKPIPDNKRIMVKSSDEIDNQIEEQMKTFKGKHIGIMLSGGMDSAILASYLSGADAYTFRFLNGEYKSEELKRAEYYAKTSNLNLHYVDINWDTVDKYLDTVMKAKGAPVHSIEPQIYQAALQAKADGVELMIIGESSDLVFGGMDGLLAKDWSFDEFTERYTFLNPDEVLENPISMRYLYERYREEDNIDFMAFVDDVYSIESSSSYLNAFEAAEMEYYDPYAKLKMAEPLDLYRVRSGESKYLIRQLMKKKYPDIDVPTKVPMPRLVDMYFENWKGPTRTEFRTDIELSKYTGNQKWQMYCLERFLNLLDETIEY